MRKLKKCLRCDQLHRNKKYCGRKCSNIPQPLPEERKCRLCNHIKPINQFVIARVIKGIEYRRYLCKPCYQINKYEPEQKNRQRYIDYKKTLFCNKCGIKDFRVIEFHHKDRNAKKYNISNLAYKYSWNTIMKEINKCIPLCANCHRIAEWEQINMPT